MNCPVVLIGALALLAAPDPSRASGRSDVAQPAQNVDAVSRAAILKAQQGQARRRAYTVGLTVSPGLGFSRLVYVAPDRYHYRESSTEIVQIGGEAWEKTAGPSWTPQAGDFYGRMLRRFRSPPQIDAAEYRVTGARTLAPAEVNGVRSATYQYVVAGDDETMRVTVWVAPPQNLPVQYRASIDRGGDKSTETWRIVYDGALTVDRPDAVRPRTVRDEIRNPSERQAPVPTEPSSAATGANIDATEPIRLERPPFPAAPAAARPAAGARARLVLQSTRSEPPGTLAFWPILGDQRGLVPKYDVLASMGVKRPTNLPEGTPQFFRGERLTRAIQQPDRLLLIYGIREKRLLVSYDPATRKAEWALDFESYGRWPADDAAEKRGTFQDVTWAAQVDGTLYVSHAHPTYARFSGGRNAYVTAIDVASRRILWRSAPLVANAHNFLVEGDSIVMGYGFTAEDDSVFVLNRKTGAIVQKIPVKSSPVAIVRRDNGIEVHTYDRTVHLFTVQP